MNFKIDYVLLHMSLDCQFIHVQRNQVLLHSYTGLGPSKQLPPLDCIALQ